MNALVLTDTAIEWASATGKARWMPFACMRLIGFSYGRNGQRQLRISGPPGVLRLAEDQLGQEAFVAFATAAVEGASSCGCGLRLKRQRSSGRWMPGWLWVRMGASLSAEEALDKLRMT